MKITQDTPITQEIQCSCLGIVLPKKLRKKKLIKVRSFSGAKVSFMYNNVKPTIREFNPNHIILHNIAT